MAFMRQLLAPGLAMQVLAVPTSQTLSLLGRQHLQLASDICRLLACAGIVAGLASNGFGAAADNIHVAGVVTAFAYALLWAAARWTVQPLLPRERDARVTRS